MPEATTQERPAERASEGQGWGGWLAEKFKDAAVYAGAGIGFGPAVQAAPMVALKNSDTPGTGMMGMLAQQEGFKEGQPGRAGLDAVRNDPEFMTALNSALRSDRSILTRLAAAGGQEGGVGPQQLIESLKDPENRQLMTKVLTVVGKDENDGFGATYLSEVIGNANAGNYAELDGLLEQGGISDSRVKMGAQMKTNPLGAIAGFLGDPEKRDSAIKSWIDNPNGPFANLDPGAKNMIAGLVQGLSKMLGIYMPGQGIVDPYIDLAKRVGGEFSANGAALRGVAQTPEPHSDGLVGSSGNPSAARLSSTFNVGGLNQQPALEPDAGTPSPQVARVEHRVQGQTMSGQSLG